MNNQKIDITFDDDEFNNNKKIVIDIKEELKLDADKIVIADNFYEDVSIPELPVSSYYNANSGNNKYFDINLKFPTGVESGFRKKYSLEIGFEFFSSILVNKNNLILTSADGEIIFISKESGKIVSRYNINGELIEKTGLVIEEKIFIPTLNSLNLCNENNFTTLYNAETGYYIWSNLNHFKNKIIFSVYSPNNKIFKIILFDIEKNSYSEIYEKKISNYLIDTFTVHKNTVFYKFDKSILALFYILENENLKLEIIDTNIENDAFIISLNQGIVLSDRQDIYFLNLTANEKEFKYSGISCYEINSIAGYGDHIYIGTGNGWCHYKTSGVNESIFDDNEENIVRALNHNILCVSKKNKIIFYNLNNINEAEGFIINSENISRLQEITSVYFETSNIYVLTDKGILTCFTNDKLNIHI